MGITEQHVCVCVEREKRGRACPATSHVCVWGGGRGVLKEEMGQANFFPFTNGD